MSPKNFPPHIVDEGASYQADKMLWKPKPLSDEEIKELIMNSEGLNLYSFVRMIEERHGIK